MKKICFILALVFVLSILPITAMAAGKSVDFSVKSDSSEKTLNIGDIVAVTLSFGANNDGFAAGTLFFKPSDGLEYVGVTFLGKFAESFEGDLAEAVAGENKGAFGLPILSMKNMTNKSADLCEVRFKVTDTSASAASVKFYAYGLVNSGLEEVVAKVNGGGESATVSFSIAKAEQTPDITPAPEQHGGNTPAADEKWKNPFKDVFATDSYYDAVRFVCERQLFNGVSSDRFAPSSTMTRAMFVTVLGRLAGVDTAKYTGSSFRDTEKGQWYSAYVEWAAKEKIVLGYGDGSFGINNKVTIEQAAVIIARYAEYSGISVKDGSLDGFSDKSAVANWASREMKWAVASGVYSGNNGMLSPKSYAPRSLVAEMMYSFVEKVLDK